MFFSRSTKRWAVLLKHITLFTLKPLSDTRWESRVEAIRALLLQLPEIYEALVEIAEDTQLTGKGGMETRAEALSLANKLNKFEFVLSLIVWFDVLSLINITSKFLQSPSASLGDCVKELNKIRTSLREMRTDEKFEELCTRAKEKASQFSIYSDFETEQPRRIRRVPQQFDYEARDEPLQDAKSKFKIQFYNAILDNLIVSVDERFDQLENICSLFEFLYDINSMKDKTEDEISLLCKQLQVALTMNEDSDINATELCGEVIWITSRVEPKTRPLATLKYIFDKELQNTLPNLVIALQIFLTLPVSVASGERSFSKLKIIKNYMRSTMTQDRLTGLAVLAIEKDETETLDIKELIKDFANKKARKIRFSE